MKFHKKKPLISYMERRSSRGGGGAEFSAVEFDKEVSGAATVADEVGWGCEGG
ncbi:hypothetical protein HanPSC8_Chr10g0433851 [Helianthus annuus]|nr:hypothetical protein HanPSC8_Chr10g0433851 [Helianthus annuus]